MTHSALHVYTRSGASELIKDLAGNGTELDLRLYSHCDEFDTQEIQKMNWRHHPYPVIYMDDENMTKSSTSIRLIAEEPIDFGTQEKEDNFKNSFRLMDPEGNVLETNADGKPYIKTVERNMTPAGKGYFTKTLNEELVNNGEIKPYTSLIMLPGVTCQHPIDRLRLGFFLPNIWLMPL